MSAEFLPFPDWSTDLPDDWRLALEDRTLMHNAFGAGEMLAAARNYHSEHKLLRVVDQMTIWAVFTRDQVAARLDWSDAKFRQRCLKWVSEGGYEAGLPRLEDAVRMRLADLLKLEAESSILHSLTANVFWRPGNPLALMQRVSVRTLIAAQRELKWERERAGLPFLRYLCDHYQSDDDNCGHSDRHGLIFEVGDPVWDWMLPPNSFVCNCNVEQVSDRRMKEEGWIVSKAEERPERPSTNGYDRRWAKVLPEAAAMPVRFVEMKPPAT